MATKEDTLPEFTKYKDTGCDLAVSCLDCPFPKCILDNGGKDHYFIKKRDSEIVRLRAEGKTYKELCLMFNVRLRTIQRVCQVKI